MTLIEFKSLKYKNKTKNFGLINFENELTVSKRCVSINLRSIYYLIKKAFKSNQKPFKDFTCKLLFEYLTNFVTLGKINPWYILLEEILDISSFIFLPNDTLSISSLL